MTHRRRKDSAVSCVYEVSSDLLVWTPIVANAVVVDPDVDGDGSVERVAVTVPLDGRGRLFVRLAVSE